MGLVSNDLKNIVDRLGDAKNSINAKYGAMRINNTTSPQADLEHLYINELAPSIDKIECLNTYGDIEADPKNILEGTVVFSQGKAIVGEMPNHGRIEETLAMGHSMIQLPAGYYDDSEIYIQIKSHWLNFSHEPRSVTSDTERMLSSVTVAGNPDYTIVYVANQEGQVADVQLAPFEWDFNISETIPARDDGAHFLGWSDTATAAEAQYTAGQLISTALAERGDTLVLYAVWKENEPPSPPALAFAYENDAKLQADGKEVAIITITPGVDPEGQPVMNTLVCESSNADKVTLTKISETQYRAEFSDIGIFVFLVTSTDPNGLSASEAATASILGADGTFGGQGSFSVDADDGTFTSETTNLIAGCYIAQITLNITISGSHSNSSDYVNAFLTKTDGTVEERRIHSGNFGSGTITITKAFTLEDDVRQIAFKAVTPGHESCISDSSTVTWDIVYKFDMSLWDGR